MYMNQGQSNRDIDRHFLLDHKIMRIDYLFIKNPD